MDKSKEEFSVFMHQAVKDRKSLPHEELYQFLVGCFIRADINMNGKVERAQFDQLIEDSASLPRAYGFAPKTPDLYANDSIKNEARGKMFDSIDVEKKGYITLSQWIKFAQNHIRSKMSHLPKDLLGGSSKDVSKEEFMNFIKLAVDKRTPEYRRLYFFLWQTFQKGDVDRKGLVDHVAFDKMIEEAAAAPRRHGLAPKTWQMFKNDSERIEKRKQYFRTMDKDGNGVISFDEWLNYAMKHITVKVAQLC